MMTRYAWSRSGGFSVGGGGFSPSSPWWVRSSATAPLLLFPPRYTASASVLLPGQWEERELLTQMDIATSSAVVDRAAATLGWSGVSGTELRDQVSAKAADGNIIKISGTADTPERAQRLSDQVAQQFVTFATRIAGGSTDPEAATATEALRKQVDGDQPPHQRAGQRGRSGADRGERAGPHRAREAAHRAAGRHEEAGAGRPGDQQGQHGRHGAGGPADRRRQPPTRMQLIAGGALLFFLLAVIGHLTAARMSRRLRTEPEIAAALGLGAARHRRRAR